MASTETAITLVIANALKDIAGNLGFSGSGNVRDYALRYEHPAHVSSYLMADVEGKKQIRCWSVDVEPGTERVIGTGKLQERPYDIEVTGYYGLGTGGSGIVAIRAHARKVISAIRNLTVSLSGTVDLIDLVSSSRTDVIKDNVPAGEAGMLIKTLYFKALKQGPDY